MRPVKPLCFLRKAVAVRTTFEWTGILKKPQQNPLSKKIPVANSPWNRSFERPSDCARWINQEHAFLVDGVLHFTKKFLAAMGRMRVEADPTGADDGIERRWVSAASGRCEVKQGIAVNGELIRTREASASCGYGLIVTSPAGIDAKQLLPVNHVGTGRHVSKKRDELTRRQPPARGITESLKSA